MPEALILSSTGSNCSLPPQTSRPISTVHSLRRAFAVLFLTSHPGALESLQALMSHSRVDTTEVYLRSFNRDQAMEAVRDLSWNTTSGFQSEAGIAHTGFEPVPPP